ncbi:MAG: helix-turn-helix transcriptional regulator [Clostridiaceae bacterium]|nr:helix-turn-helix transcriptional regulator [Clostridiaceae bacterium]
MSRVFKHQLLRLLFIYTALEAFRHIGWMLFYEQLIHNTRQEVNTGFILYSGAIMITALFIPLILKYVYIENNTKKLRLIFISSVCSALLFRVLQIFSGIIGAYIFLVLWTIAIMVCICICFIHIFELIPRAMLGRYIGIAYFADALIVSFVEHFTGTPEYFFASIFVGIALCLIAVIMYIRHSKSEKPDPDIVEIYDWVPSRRFVKIAFAVLVVYVLIAGMTDNLYFFDDWLELPYVGLFTLPMMGIMYLISGFIFDKFKLKITIPLAFVFICVAQSMTFFVTDRAFSYLHSVFSNFGSTFLHLAAVIFPIYYARINKRGFGFAPFGEGFFYGGFCLTSIWFLFLKQSAYRPVMGGILLAAIFCLVLLINLIILYERNKHQREMEVQHLTIDSLKQAIVAYPITPEALRLSAETLNIHFTKREEELLPLIVSVYTAEEIAQKANLSVSTVRFHVKNILGKTSAKNRRELVRMFSVQQEHQVMADNEYQQ